MSAAIITAHEFGSGALTARVAAGLIAHCSGKADDFRCETTRRVEALIGKRGEVDIYRDSRGEWRAVIDNDRGYFDHVLPQAIATKAIARAS